MSGPPADFELRLRNALASPALHAAMRRGSGPTNRPESRGGHWHARCSLAAPRCRVKDLVFVLITVGFFAVSWLYVRACERL